MIFIIKFFIIYYIAGTFLLLNILFNPAIHFKVTSKKNWRDCRCTNLVFNNLLYMVDYFFTNIIKQCKKGE